jgi:hypothetical protein
MSKARLNGAGECCSLDQHTFTEAIMDVVGWRGVAEYLRSTVLESYKR